MLRTWHYSFTASAYKFLAVAGLVLEVAVYSSKYSRPWNTLSVYSSINTLQHTNSQVLLDTPSQLNGGCYPTVLVAVALFRHYKYLMVEYYCWQQVFWQYFEGSDTSTGTILRGYWLAGELFWSSLITVRAPSQPPDVSCRSDPIPTFLLTPPQSYSNTKLDLLQYSVFWKSVLKVLVVTGCSSSYLPSDAQSYKLQHRIRPSYLGRVFKTFIIMFI